LAASIDGAIPFADPLEALGIYNSSCFGLAFSKRVGGAALSVLVPYAGARRIAFYTFGKAPGTIANALNHNRYIRIGLGKTLRYKGAEAPRVAFGCGGFHLDLSFFGR